MKFLLVQRTLLDSNRIQMAALNLSSRTYAEYTVQHTTTFNPKLLLTVKLCGSRQSVCNIVDLKRETVNLLCFCYMPYIMHTSSVLQSSCIYLIC